MGRRARRNLTLRQDVVRRTTMRPR
jgi:hypothetical protein